MMGLLICSQITWIFLFIAFFRYGQGSKGSSMLSTRGSPLGRILEDWSTYCHYPKSKEALVCYCDTVWPTYVLDCEERWPMYGSLSYWNSIANS